MRPEEVSIIKGWRKLDKEVDELVFTWSRWKKWETDPPIVAVTAGQVVGYHAVSFTKSGYVNSASQFVLPEYRGQGLGSMMIGKLLEEANERGATRLRFRCPHDDNGLGMQVWTGFGLKPIAEGNGDYWFDVYIGGITELKSLAAKGKTLHKVVTTDKRTLGYYRRTGLIPLVPEYKGIL